MKNGFATLGAAGLLLSFGICWGGESVALKDEKDRISYSIGYQVGIDMKSQGVDFNPEALVRGARDAGGDGKLLMNPQEMRNTLVEFRKKMTETEGKQRKAQSEAYRGEGREFLAGNAKKEGVVTLPSGLQYQVLKEGKGKSPALKDTVTVHYRGTLIDGKEFGSSEREGKPATFPVTNTIPGWREALPLMKQGAKWKLYIPADLAFGERGPLADRTVIYEIELLDVKSE